jgi:hypothetical protein
MIRYSEFDEESRFDPFIPCVPSEPDRSFELLTVLECVGSGERLSFGVFPGVSSRSPHR